ncbi:2-hydroxy-3-keto-5-methylthiopentenyl-1-phosphate phosphatase [Exiguobacterium sp. SL-9]|uniref:2-hydroxy-3-keto-5-methylthiopentenyl-1- phosphate phosphatase n=1 Tax=Exiguobacterium sp. SL-9 TaxID=2510963 RepID=UPI00103C0A08|nr:2-hydroxy-3-keto-5-methylthiopentenyl-1-phosphate phosphatase [Exiguobacterium sp. SL-9]TCI21738.1 2-hydroxy-3-keto-5-methylthiopentenyl-1-phosphate phosphatase [Exiguobacterium sp. SL-9]
MTVHILCDFDGTITAEDNIIALMKAFAPPDWVELKDAVLEQRMSIRSGVGQMFALLPSTDAETYRDYLLNRITVRQGFPDLLAQVEAHGWKFDVVSGGMDFFVQPILAGYVDPEHIYCNVADFSDETVTVAWPYACDEQCTNDCGCCKPTIARRIVNPADRLIVIGDSVTDFEVAKRADVVYARGQLITLCEAEGIAYAPFETFDDITHHLQEVAV